MPSAAVDPGASSRNTLKTFSLATVAAIGTYPDANPLAKVAMSGRTPEWSMPNIRPVRPKPDTTSSKMRRTP